MCFDLAPFRTLCSIAQMAYFLQKKGLRCLCLLRKAVCRAQPSSSEVWNSFLILSYLSALLTSVDASQLKEIRSLVPKKNNIIESDGLFYTPHIEKILREKDCACSFLDCYLKELHVYQNENELSDINTIKDLLLDIQAWPSKCPQCEDQPLTNITTFLSSLNITLDYLTTWDINCFF